MNNAYLPALPPSIRRVFVADDHNLVREGLCRILESASDIQIVGQADNGHTALTQITQLQPHVAILDLSMPGLSGMNLIKRIKHDVPSASILVLTMHGEEQYAMRAFRCGANGYLTKDSATDELVRAVHRVAEGKVYLSLSMAERVAISLNTSHDKPRHTLLTDREYEVLALLVKGIRLTEIGQQLHLSVKTISTHKSRILEKMGLDTTAALVRYTLQHHLFMEDLTAN
jgi:DNA-binding NarL/FixJ family response regulator